MSEERIPPAPGSQPTGVPPGTDAQANPATARQRMQSATDPGRMPAIPGLIAPRLSNRGAGDNSAFRPPPAASNERTDREAVSGSTSVTAMRIISIESDAPPRVEPSEEAERRQREYSESLESEAAQLQSIDAVDEITAELPELDEGQLSPITDSVPPPVANVPPVSTEPVEALPSFELSEPIAVGEIAVAERAAAQSLAASAASASAFSWPESEDPSHGQRLPSFELESAEPPRAAAVRPSVRPSSIVTPLNSSRPSPAESRPSPIPPAPAPRASQSQSVPLMEGRPASIPPRSVANAETQPVTLSDDDLITPDSAKPAPPVPPSRAAAPPREATGGAGQRTSVPSIPVSSGTDAEPAVSARRNPPKPPQRRSFPVPADSAVESSAEPGRANSRANQGVDPLVDKTKSEERAKGRRPWWEELFNEDFSRAQSRLSDVQVKREATFIEESLGVNPGGVLLDLGCGAGHHAVELAQRGYAVVGYDLSLHQLALAADMAQDKQQKLNLMQGDMRDMAFDSVFDGIYCWDTTFGYFEEEKNVAVAARIFQALKPGGAFLIDVINRDFVAMQQPSSVWFEGDTAVCMDDMSVDFISSRLKVKRSVMLDDGRTRECHYSIRLYSLHELGKLLHEVGFRIAEASGQASTPGVFMGQNSPRIIILAQRP